MIYDIIKIDSQIGVYMKNKIISILLILTTFLYSNTINESNKKFLIFINNKEISSVLNEPLTENQRMIKTKYIVSIGIRIHLL